MRLLRILTAGESHGPGLTGIIEGMPAGLAIDAAYIDEQLARRQRGHGRGARMKIEKDRVVIRGGVRRGRTLGSPIALHIENCDWKNWREVMLVEAGGDETLKAVHIPRPGHADYPGAMKYGHRDLRDVLERASARETAARVALGSVARRFLEEFGVHVASRVVSIGGEVDDTDADAFPVPELNARADSSPVRALDAKAARRMIAAIDAARRDGDTLGGEFEVRVAGLPAGLGSYVHWDRRIEGDLARAFMSLNAIKGVEVGMGFRAARLRGSAVHDELFWDPARGGVVRRSNRSGGIDGGVTTGEPLVVRAAMKPIATILRPLASVDLKKKKEARAHIERSDTCAVPAAAVIGESLAALELADAFLIKFGGDSIPEIRSHYESERRA
jgi:chorismate synthase